MSISANRRSVPAGWRAGNEPVRLSAPLPHSPGRMSGLSMSRRRRCGRGRPRVRASAITPGRSSAWPAITSMRSGGGTDWAMPWACRERGHRTSHPAGIDARDGRYARGRSFNGGLDARQLRLVVALLGYGQTRCRPAATRHSPVSCASPSGSAGPGAGGAAERGAAGRPRHEVAQRHEEFLPRGVGAEAQRRTIEKKRARGDFWEALTGWLFFGGEDVQGMTAFVTS
jgi:hypothetical protein